MNKQTPANEQKPTMASINYDLEDDLEDDHGMGYQIAYTTGKPSPMKSKKRNWQQVDKLRDEMKLARELKENDLL